MTYLLMSTAAKSSLSVLMKHYRQKNCTISKYLKGEMLITLTPQTTLLQIFWISIQMLISKSMMDPDNDF